METDHASLMMVASTLMSFVSAIGIMLVGFIVKGFQNSVIRLETKVETLVRESENRIGGRQTRDREEGFKRNEKMDDRLDSSNSQLNRIETLITEIQRGCSVRKGECLERFEAIRDDIRKRQKDIP